MATILDGLRTTSKEDKYTHYEIIKSEDVAWVSTNDYVIAKKAYSLFGKPFNESFAYNGDLLELAWRVSLCERKKLAKVGLNGNALGRKKKTVEIMQQ